MAGHRRRPLLGPDRPRRRPHERRDAVAPPPSESCHTRCVRQIMGSTGESLRLKVFGIMRVSATKALRELRVEELTAPGADRLLDEVLAIEKAMASLKVLSWPGRGDRGRGGPGGFARPEDDLARRRAPRTVRPRTLLAAVEAGDGSAEGRGRVAGRGVVRGAGQLITDRPPQRTPPPTACVVGRRPRPRPLHGLQDRCGRAKAAADRMRTPPTAASTPSGPPSPARARDGAVNGAFTASPGHRRGGPQFDGLLPTVP